MASYKIDDIEGIGPAYAAKLREAGVKTTSALLKHGATKKGRSDLSSTTGIDASMLLRWVNMADLYRLSGVGSEYAELLEKAGVDTVKELRRRNAENLHKKMTEVNSNGRRLVRQLPSASKVQGWIEQAQQLDAVVTH